MLFLNEHGDFTFARIQISLLLSYTLATIIKYLYRSLDSKIKNRKTTFWLELLYLISGGGGLIVVLINCIITLSNYILPSFAGVFWSLLLPDESDAED